MRLINRKNTYMIECNSLEKTKIKEFFKRSGVFYTFWKGKFFTTKSGFPVAKFNKAFQRKPCSDWDGYEIEEEELF